MEKKRYLDVLRVVCAFAVVLLHSNEGIWMFSFESYWIEATVATMIFLFAVPCFVMASGALLIDYSDRYPTKTFIEKRIEKTVVPYIAWCLIGIAYLIYRKALSFEQLSIKTVVRMIVNNEVLPIYWFFISIFAIYLFTPILTFISKDKKKRVFEYIIVSMYVMNVALPFFWKIAGFGAFQIQTPITTLCLYYVTGYYIDKYPISPKIRNTIYLLSFASLLVLLFGTISDSYKAGVVVQTYMGYADLPCFLYSVGIFCAFKQLSEPRVHNERLEGILFRVVDFFVNETLGIYLVHWYVLNELKVRLGLIHSDFIYRIPVGIAVFFISWLITKLLRKIPVVKRIVP